MPTQSYTLAQDALDRVYLNNGMQSVSASCVCGDDLDGRMLLVREVDGDDLHDSLVADDGTGDGPSILGRCWTCDRDLVPDVVVLRDRQRRVERHLHQAVA